MSHDITTIRRFLEDDVAVLNYSCGSLVIHWCDSICFSSWHEESSWGSWWADVREFTFETIRRSLVKLGIKKSKNRSYWFVIEILDSTTSPGMIYLAVVDAVGLVSFKVLSGLDLEWKIIWTCMWILPLMFRGWTSELVTCRTGEEGRRRSLQFLLAIIFYFIRRVHQFMYS